uniref:Membrane protein n=1 Tax=Staphylococcus phage 184DA TaxID=3110532 RepID=A0AAU6MX76_9CAUD
MPVIVPHIPVVSNPTTTNPTTTSGNTETREETISHDWEPDLISDTEAMYITITVVLMAIIACIGLWIYAKKYLNK